VVEEEEVAFFHPLERRAVPAVVVDGPQTDFVEVGEGSGRSSYSVRSTAD